MIFNKNCYLQVHMCKLILRERDNVQTFFTPRYGLLLDNPIRDSQTRLYVVEQAFIRNLENKIYGFQVNLS